MENTDYAAGPTFGQRIRQARRDRGIMQRDLASEVGLSAPTLSQIENNKRAPRKETIRRLGEHLELDPAYIEWYLTHYPPRLTAPTLNEIIDLCRKYPRFSEAALDVVVETMLVWDRDYDKESDRELY